MIGRSGPHPEPRQRLAFRNLTVIVLLPVVVHLPVLLPWLTVDPILWWSGLAWTPPALDQLVPGNPGWADGNAGVTTEALGHLAADDWLHGVIPWWNPYGGVGLPLAAEMQNSALFLPFILLTHLPNGVVLLKICMQALTGAATFALARTLVIVPGVACLCGILAEFNGTFAWYAHGPIMPVAFLPLLLLGIERCRLAVQAGRGGGWALVAIALAWSIYAGFPETALLDGLFGAAFTLARLLALPNRTTRLAFAFRTASAGLCGLLLSAPASVPFLDFLRHAYLSLHANYSFAHELPGNPAMLILPYVFGPPLFNFFTTGEGQALWWNTGGYVGISLVVLAVHSLVHRGGRDGTLRVVLGLWLLATFLKAMGHPAAVAVWNLIPFVKHSLFPVYIAPSWEFAAILLAALTLDDWVRQPDRIRRSSAAIAFGTAIVFLAWALHDARPEIVRLIRHAHDYLAVAAPLAAIALVAAATAAVLLAGRSSERRLRVLSLVLASEAFVTFAVPLLSATRTRPLDGDAIAFLRAHLGLQRLYSMSVLQPNYGAYWRVASVNHNYLPVPQNWVDDLHTHINPAMDGVQFFGDTLRPPGEASLADEISPAIATQAAVNTLAGYGVRYILTPHDLDPFTDTAGTPVAVVNDQPVPLASAASVSFSFRSPLHSAAAIEAVGVEIGTYLGTASGTLDVSLCASGVCRDGQARLQGAADNAVLWMRLGASLSVEPGVVLTARLTHENGGGRVAIWLCPVKVAGLPPARLPLMLFRFGLTELGASRVFADRLLDIYALAGTSPYDEDVSGHCALHPRSRRVVVANCLGSGLLVRRELFYPGWRATVDGQPAILSPAGLFQSVPLPTGRSRIVFTYRPRWIVPAAIAMGIAALWLLASLILAQAPRRA